MGQELKPNLGNLQYRSLQAYQAVSWTTTSHHEHATNVAAVLCRILNGYFSPAEVVNYQKVARAPIASDDDGDISGGPLDEHPSLAGIEMKAGA